MISIPLNLRGIVSVSIGVTILMIIYIWLNSKDKLDYERSTGQITYLDKQLGQLPVRNPGKYRYLQVRNYAHPFEIFVGNESGDFKPAFEQIDNLMIGDTITVFYYQTEDTQREGVNRFIQYIDKGGESYFERGNSSRTLGVVVISACVFMTMGGVVLWKMKKIKF